MTDTSNDGPGTFLLLDDGYAVPKTFYDAIRRQVEDVLPALVPGAKYTVQQLCGETFWGALTDGQCRLAGRCMAHLVAHGKVPLRFAAAKHEYPKHYELARLS